MGSASRVKPEYLAEKLLTIRNSFNCSQSEMANKLTTERIIIRRSDVSRYELGIREPSLIILFRYARLANVAVEVLIDDELNLS